MSIALNLSICDILYSSGSGGGEVRLSANAFELVSLGMRYWFVFLGLMIVLRAARWALHDHRAFMHTLRSLPDAGCIGEIVNLDTGLVQALPREGVMGSGKACDIRFKGLRRRELVYELREGKGILLMPSHKNNQILMEGIPLTSHDYALHGSQLSFPGYSLRMRLFEGLDIPKRDVASMQEGNGFLQSGEEFNLEDYASEGSSQQLPMTASDIVQYPSQDQSPQPDGSVEQMTWINASAPAGQQTDMPLPWEDFSGDDASDVRILHAQELEKTAQSHRRRRRSQRHEK
jgi:hypothetical protein